MELPPEIWVKIFSHLHNGHPRFLEPVSLVSKQFLTLTNSLRTTLSLPNVPTQFLQSLFLRFKTLNSMDLSSFRGDPTSILLQIPCYYPHLHSLNLSKQPNLPLYAFREIGCRLKGLKTLTLSDIGDLDDDDLVTVADCFPNLEGLDISYPEKSYNFSSVTDDGISALSLKLKNLNRIDISGNKLVTNTGVIDLSINCVFLKSFAVNRCFLVTLKVINLLLKNRPGLEELFVRGIANGWQDPFKYQPTSFEFARCLSRLDLSFLFVPDKWLFLITKGRFPLKSLYLCSSYGFSIQGLVSVLDKHRRIERLDCQCVNFLTDYDISVLSGFLSELVYVNLRWCTKLTVMAFYYLTRACPSLKEVEMRKINMLEEEDSSMHFAITSQVRSLCLEEKEDSLMHFATNSQVRSLCLDSDFGLSDRCLEKFLSLCPSLRFLNVSNCPELSEEAVLHVMKTCREITHLEINLCKIKNLNIDFDVLSLEVLRARRAGLDGEALAAIGKRCRNLRRLDLAYCHNVSADGVKAVVANCKGLREINVKGCKQLDVDIISWMVLTRPSLRKIILPYGFKPSEAQRNFFLTRGCLVCEEK